MQERPVPDEPVARTNIERLTNAIFAFALLLLFYKINIPNSGNDVGYEIAQKFGLLQLPSILNFVNLFLIVALVWVVMFHIFHQTAWSDRTFLYLHFILLLLVIVIPITYGFPFITMGNAALPILIHLNMLAIGRVLVLEWRHCQKKPSLLKPEILQAGIPPCTRISLLIIPVTALAGCIMVICHLPGTQYIYVMAVIALAILGTWLLHDGEKKTGRNDHPGRYTANRRRMHENP